MTEYALRPTRVSAIFAEHAPGGSNEINTPTTAFAKAVAPAPPRVVTKKAVSRPQKRQSGPKASSPLSIRLSETQRAQLVRDAEGQPLSRYVKSVLFAPLGDGSSSRAAAETNRSILAQLLAALGSSEIGPGLSALSKSIDYGTLTDDAEIMEALRKTQDELAWVKQMLVTALGLKSR